MIDSQKLIERLTKLDEPCRECDGLIAEYIGESFGMAETIDLESRSYTIRLQQKLYTSSMDAAMTSVPDGWEVYAITFDSIIEGLVETELRESSIGIDDAWGYHSLPAISICIASIYAIEGISTEC